MHDPTEERKRMIDKPVCRLFDRSGEETCYGTTLDHLERDGLFAFVKGRGVHDLL